MSPNLAYLRLKDNRFSKCADERLALASLGMAASVSKDPAEAEAAALFKRLLDASDWTHETLADKVGVSPGRVSQWATNRGPIPPERAVPTATALGTRPELISVGWRHLRNEFVASHLGRLTEATIARAVIVAKQALAETGVARLNIERDPEIFAQALRAVIADELSGDGGGHESARGIGSAGSIGGSTGKAKAGAAPRPAAGGKRKRA